MQEIAYYEEYQDKKTKLVSNKTVLAVLIGRGLFFDKGSVNVGAVGYSKDQDAIVPTCVSLSYLHDACKKITEKVAREIHPALFEYIDKYKNPVPTLPHDLNVVERLAWLLDNRPDDNKEFRRWCIEQRETELATRGQSPVSTQLCGTCGGVPYSSLDENRGL